MRVIRAIIVPKHDCKCAVCSQAVAESASIIIPAAIFLLVLALVLFLPRLAHAQGLGSPIGDPCAPGAYDPDAGLTVPHATFPDGGPEDVPLAICPGQRAPVAGVLLTVPRAAQLAGERAGDRARIAALEHSLEQADTTTPALLGTLAGAVTTALVVWCTSHQCNPLHGGK